MLNLITFLSSFIFALACYDNEDAMNCKNHFDCCNDEDECGASYSECLPENGGKPKTDHCYYLRCSECCIMGTMYHYCASKQECQQLSDQQYVIYADQSLRFLRPFIIAFICVYFFVLVVLFIFGCYRSSKVKGWIRQIQEKSAKYDTINRGANIELMTVSSGSQDVKI